MTNTLIHRISILHAIAVAAIMLAAPSVLGAQAATQLPVPLPDDTRVSTVKYGDNTALDLKPAEQVAFVFVYTIWNLEQRSLDKDSGIGRLAAMGELVKGIKTQGGVFGLKVTPTRDTNYNYSIIIIGDACLIRAVPRAKGLAGFALMGAASGMSGSFYVSPEGADMSKAVKLTEYGFEGNGFSR